jgi:hypothetical protein
MTKAQAEFLKEATEYCGNQEIDLRSDYSGRGMYGKETCGVVVDSLTVLLADCIAYIKEVLNDNIDAIPELDSFKTDNMGRSIIIY